jgi:hypothetical protein
MLIPIKDWESFGQAVSVLMDTACKLSQEEALVRKEIEG